jgi:aryl-alcohol dehydrogenase-like predicted oxidoreductase
VIPKRILGRTGLEVSSLGFGCGAVGGLLVAGTASEQKAAIARAVDLGVTYFDTAALYGNGRSETNLGRVLSELGLDVLVGTKVRVDRASSVSVSEQIARSAEASLRRLRRDYVDLFQLHNVISATAADGLPVDVVLAEVVPAFQALQRAGKIRHFGITAFGETAAIKRVITSNAFDTAQVIYNLLNPSAGSSTAPRMPGVQNFDDILVDMASVSMGGLGIRVLAGGALSGSESRHPNSLQTVEPFGSGARFEDDVQFAQRFIPVVTKYRLGDLVEASLRFTLSQPTLATTLVGIADLAQMEHAAAAIAKGPFTEEEIAQLLAI